MNNIESSTGEIVMYQPDETIRLEVRMDEETVWLSANYNQRNRPLTTLISDFSFQFCREHFTVLFLMRTLRI